MKVENLKDKDQVYLRKNLELGDIAYIPIGTPLNVIRRNFGPGSTPIGAVLGTRLGVNLFVDSEKFDDLIADFEENALEANGAIDNA